MVSKLNAASALFYLWFSDISFSAVAWHQRHFFFLLSQKTCISLCKCSSHSSCKLKYIFKRYFCCCCEINKHYLVYCSDGNFLYITKASLKCDLFKAVRKSYDANKHPCHIIHPLSKGFQCIFIGPSSVHFYTKVHLEMKKWLILDFFHHCCITYFY